MFLNNYTLYVRYALIVITILIIIVLVNVHDLFNILIIHA